MSTTYTELVANLQSWLEDDDLEFQGSIPEIVSLGQQRLWRDLDLSIFTSEDTAPTVASDESVTKPATDPQLVAWTSIYYDNAGERIWLELRSTDFVRDYQTPGATAAPKYYAEQAEGEIVLAPIPDAIYTLNFRGITRPTELGPGQENTWLGDHQGDMLFRACLAESEAFLKSDDRVAQWVEWYNAGLPLAKRETYTMLQEHYQLTPGQLPPVPTTAR